MCHGVERSFFFTPISKSVIGLILNFGVLLIKSFMKEKKESSLKRHMVFKYLMEQQVEECIESVMVNS